MCLAPQCLHMSQPSFLCGCWYDPDVLLLFSLAAHSNSPLPSVESRAIRYQELGEAFLALTGAGGSLDIRAAEASRCLYQVKHRANWRRQQKGQWMIAC